MKNIFVSRKMSKILEGVGQYSLVIFIGFCMLGLVGLLIALGISVASIPIVLGATASSGRREYNTVSQGGWWSNLTGKQRGTVGLFLALMIPFLALAFIWLVLMGVSLYLDILVIVPPILVILFLYFRFFRTSEQRDSNIITKTLSSRVVGLVAIIILLVVLIGASYGFISESPAISRNNSGASNNGVVNNNTLLNITDNQTIDDIIELPNTFITIRVVDTFFTQDGEAPEVLDLEKFVSVVNGTMQNVTLLDMSNPDAYGIPTAKITVTGYDFETQLPVKLISYTDQYGYATINNLTEGNWTTTISKTGYMTYNGTLPVTPSLIADHDGYTPDTWTTSDVDIIMKPTIYKVGITYTAQPTDYADQRFDTPKEWCEYILEQYLEKTGTTSNPAILLYFAFIGAETYDDATNTAVVSNYSVFITADYLGAIDKEDVEEINRQDSWYGWTTINVGTGQAMFTLKNQLQGFINSYLGALQSVLPALQGWMNVPSSVTYQVYNGHKIELVLAESGSGDALYVNKLPTPNSLSQNITPDSVNNIGRSSLHLRYYELAVWTDEPSFKLGLNVTSYFSNYSVEGIYSDRVPVLENQYTLYQNILLDVGDYREPEEFNFGETWE